LVVKPCASVDQMPSAQRRFPPPWSAEEQDACFVVRDHNGQALAYVNFPGGCVFSALAAD